MFTADLPGMPPDRDIDFCIDLEPGTRPISISPYTMDPAELRELKAQLQELLGKDFIRSSNWKKIEKEERVGSHPLGVLMFYL